MQKLENYFVKVTKGEQEMLKRKLFQEQEPDRDIGDDDSDDRDIEDQDIDDDACSDSITGQQEKLRDKLVNLSESNYWLIAKKEWELESIFHLVEQTCACGHKPITENCVIRNKTNGNKLIVGNSCINHFKEKSMTISANAFKSLAAIRSNSSGVTASQDLLEVAVQCCVLSNSEFGFYCNITSGKGARVHFDESHPNFSEKKNNIRHGINHLIILGFSSTRPRCCDNFMKPCRKYNNTSFWYSCVSGCKKCVSIKVNL